jgi:SAM-dependent methyltransferase
VVAIPLAERGYRVTLLDPSEEMLRIARRRAREAGVDLAFVRGSIEDAASHVTGPFDAICVHAVLMYVEDPSAALRVLRSLAADGAVLSLLEKNRDALAVRPGLRGDFTEALRVLDHPVAAGNLGIANRSYGLDGWRRMLEAEGWRAGSVVGIRLFSDLAEDDLAPDAFELLLRLEREAGRREPYRSVSRLLHLAASAAERRRA